jgi:hypothetical protein
MYSERNGKRRALTRGCLGGPMDCDEFIRIEKAKKENLSDRNVCTKQKLTKKNQENVTIYRPTLT